MRTHTDGGQTAEAVAERVVAWIGEAQRTLDLALYDVRLPGGVGDRVGDAIRAAAARGVRVRIAFNQDERPPDDGVRRQRLTQRIGSSTNAPAEAVRSPSWFSMSMVMATRPWVSPASLGSACPRTHCVSPT